MEDEIQKRNTDCVYFLASPLTCKKGIECEYRHSEGARLNPRDCYYWLAGNCLNPTCTFRHPPLDGRTESPVEPADLPNQSSVPVNKTSVPCYFYFNGFCNKGDRCSFMHGTTAILPTPKVPKATATVNGFHYPENKTSGNGMVAAVIEGAPKPSETPSKVSKATPSVNGVHHVEKKATCSDAAPSVILAPSNPSKSAPKPVLNVTEDKDDFEQSVPDNVLEGSPSLQTSEPDSEEAADKLETPLQAENFVNLCPDQSSEEQVDDQVEREEWWESSPGLDVLVDNGSDGYEDNPEYLPIHDGEARRLHEHMLQYEYDDLVGYDAMEYQGTGILYEDGIYDAYDGLDAEHVSDYAHGVAKPSMEMELDPRRFQKRKRLPKEVDVNGRSGVDLRDHLSKRKRVDGCQYRNRKKRGPSYPNERYPEWTRRNSMEYPLSRRLASEVSNPMRCLDSDKESEFSGIHRRNRLRQSEPKRSKPKPRDKERRQQTRPYISSEASRGPMSREVRPSQEHALFTGPKTLAQIKEEKRKARMNEDSSGNTRHQGRATSEDFEGPKPLSKILKEKRVGSMSDDSSNTKSKRDHVDRERNHDDYFDEDGNDFIDEYEDDDDGFKKKLASIFS